MFNLKSISPTQLEVTTLDLSTYDAVLYQCLQLSYLSYHDNAKLPALDQLNHITDLTTAVGFLVKTLDFSKDYISVSDAPQLVVVFGQDLSVINLTLTLAYLGIETELCPVSEIKSICDIKYVLCVCSNLEQVQAKLNSLTSEIFTTQYLANLEQQAHTRALANSQVLELPLINLPLYLSQLYSKNPILFPAQLVQFDLADLSSVPDIKQPGFYCSDMDMTAVKAECIDEIAALAGVGEQVVAITHKAMEGHLDFAESLRERVATLAGHPVSIIDQVKAKIQVMGGLDYLCAYLNQHNWISAIVSGGFNDFTSALTQTAQITYYYSNELEKSEGKFTGKVLGEIVGAEQKAQFLNHTISKHQLPKIQSIAIGDGANDLCMMAQAGCSIAYHAKPKVQQQAKINLRISDLRGVVVLLQAKADYLAMSK